MNVTLFTAPKPFRGPAGMAQWNAIMSWSRLEPRPEILLMGDAEGVREVSREIGALHIPEVSCNEFGTPLIDALFTNAAARAAHAVLCYANADVMFTERLLLAATAAAGRWHSFLLTGRRRDVHVDTRWDFTDPEWQRTLEAHALHNGQLDSWIAADYFAFRRGQFAALPPFALGRTVWDNWLIYAARASRVPVVDATAAVVAIHQRHDYSHYRGGRQGIWEGAEAQRNRELAGGLDHAFCIADATHVLTDRLRVIPAIRPIYLWRRAYTLPVLRPHLRPVRRLLDGILTISKPLRRRRGWTLSA